MSKDAASEVSRRAFLTVSGAAVGACGPRCRQASADVLDASVQATAKPAAPSDDAPRSMMKIAEVFHPPADGLWRMGAEEGVWFPAGASFFPDRVDPTGEHIRLAYPWTSTEELREGARRIGLACQRLAREGAAR